MTPKEALSQLQSPGDEKLRGRLMKRGARAE